MKNMLINIVVFMSYLNAYAIETSRISEIENPGLQDQTNVQSFLNSYQNLLERSADLTVLELGQQTAVLAAIYNVDLRELNSVLKDDRNFLRISDSLANGRFSLKDKTSYLVESLSHYRLTGGAGGDYTVLLPLVGFAAGITVCIAGAVVYVVWEGVQSTRANNFSCVNGQYYLSKKDGDIFSSIVLQPIPQEQVTKIFFNEVQTSCSKEKLKYAENALRMLGYNGR